MVDVPADTARKLRVEGAIAERVRIEAILTSPAGEMHPAKARHLAFRTGTDAAAAIAQLQRAPAADVHKGTASGATESDLGCAAEIFERRRADAAGAAQVAPIPSLSAPGLPDAESVFERRRAAIAAAGAA